MTLRNSLRQLFRTPVKAVLFVLLLSLAALLLTLGAGLGFLAQDNMKRFDSIFTTVGTVEQLPCEIRREEYWDAELQNYNFTEVRDYVYTDVSVLKLEGVEYLTEPERRPYFISYDASYEIADEKTGFWHTMVAVAQPQTDGIPNQPLPMEVKEVLYSHYNMNPYEILYCDHNTENPPMMYADRLYLLCVDETLGHNWKRGELNNYEWVPNKKIETDQTDREGNLIENDLSGAYCVELTEGFWETEEGGKWKELMKAMDFRFHSIPVTPVSNLNLLMPFHSGNAYLLEGETFSEEHYANGEKVCLVSRLFARNNDLELGDKLPLSLRFASYRGTTALDADVAFEGGYSCLNADGEVYKAFEEGDYRIIGIYDWAAGMARSAEYGMGMNEVLIPHTAVGEVPEDHIAAFGPMKKENVSFQIPNGTIEEYQEAWEASGIEGLELRFYDKGYTRLEENIREIQRISLILLIAGAVTSLLILIFFCHLFISKQSRRTAIERSLGVGKGKCMASLLTGLLVLVLAGSMAGSFLGYSLTETAMENIESGGHYDTAYSVGLISAEGNASEEVGMENTVGGGLPVLMGAVLFTAAFAVAAIMCGGNLKKEPLALLGSREE